MAAQNQGVPQVGGQPNAPVQPVQGAQGQLAVINALPVINYHNIIAAQIFDNDDIDFFNACMYQGLNNEIILRLLKSHEADDVVFRKDMVRVVLFFCQRGTNFDTIKFAQRTLDAQTVLAVRNLMQKYTIKMNLAVNDNRLTTITVARVIACFPHIAAAAYGSGLARPIVTNDDVPNHLSFPFAPALLYDDEWAAIKEDWLNLMVDYTMIINRGDMNRALAAAEQNNNVGNNAAVQGDNQGNVALLAMMAQLLRNNNTATGEDDAPQRKRLKVLQGQFAENAHRAGFSIQHRNAMRAQYNRLVALLYTQINPGLNIANAALLPIVNP